MKKDKFSKLQIITLRLRHLVDKNWDDDEFLVNSLIRLTGLFPVRMIVVSKIQELLAEAKKLCP